MQIGQGITPSVRLTVFMKPSAFKMKQVECQKLVAYSPQGWPGRVGIAGTQQTAQHLCK